jgi:hypothetical protein
VAGPAPLVTPVSDCSVCCELVGHVKHAKVCYTRNVSSKQSRSTASHSCSIVAGNMQWLGMAGMWHDRKSITCLSVLMFTWGTLHSSSSLKLPQEVRTNTRCADNQRLEATSEYHYTVLLL